MTHLLLLPYENRANFLDISHAANEVAKRTGNKVETLLFTDKAPKAPIDLIVCDLSKLGQLKSLFQLATEIDPDTGEETNTLIKKPIIVVGDDSKEMGVSSNHVPNGVFVGTFDPFAGNLSQTWQHIFDVMKTLHKAEPTAQHFSFAYSNTHIPAENFQFLDGEMFPCDKESNIFSYDKIGLKPKIQGRKFTPRFKAKLASFHK